jgi:hypothetical protein
LSGETKRPTNCTIARIDSKMPGVLVAAQRIGAAWVGSESASSEVGKLEGTIDIILFFM